jgi:hypothetical protein
MVHNIKIISKINQQNINIVLMMKEQYSRKSINEFYLCLKRIIKEKIKNKFKRIIITVDSGNNEIKFIRETMDQFSQKFRHNQKFLKKGGIIKIYVL